MKRFVFFVVLVFLCGGVLGVSGVVPRSYEVDFEAGYSGEFVFDFVLEGDAELYVDGDLADYVTLDKYEISGREKVVATLNLPSGLEPGVNQAFIIVKESGLDVRGAIKVVVPYPERYVGLELSASNVNVGGVVSISLDMFNLGSQVVDVVPRIEIYRDGEVVEVFYGESGTLGASESLGFNVSFDSSNYSAGDYLAVGVVDYGDVSRVENVFRLGEFKARILSYSDEFVEGEVGRFEVEVESLWDSKMSEVYAEVFIVDSGVNFDSSIVELEGWEKKTLVGAVDGSYFVEGEVGARIILHYDGGAVSEDVRLKIVRERSYVFYYYVGGGLVVGLILFFVFRKGKGDE